MQLSESELILQSIFLFSLCSSSSLVLENLKEAAWISILLIRYLSLFTLFTLFTCFEDLWEAAWISIHLIRYLILVTLFTLFTCSWGFKWGFLNLNSFYKVFFFVHFVYVVHLFSRIWKRLPESQFIWLGIGVCSLCSPCSLVIKGLEKNVWISIHFTKYFCLFTSFTSFTCSKWFERGCLNINSLD